MSVHYTALQWPWKTRDDAALAEELKHNVFHLHGDNLSQYQTMIHQMDEGIGRVMQALRDAGAERNTLVVFTRDNGGKRFSDNWPLCVRPGWPGPPPCRPSPTVPR